MILCVSYMRHVTGFSLRTSWFVCGACLLFSSLSSHAALTNLVSNGEFESPVLASNYQIFSDIGSQWTASAGNGFELWQQNFNGSPSNGSDGNPSGQSLELRGNSNTGTVTLTVTVPNNVQVGSQATLNFDAWNRGATQNTGRYQILINAVNQGTFTANTVANVWTANTRSFNVAAGDNVAVVFSDVSGGSTAVGLHMDEVEVLVNLVPEPAAIGTAVLGLLVLSTFWKQSRKVAIRSLA